MSEEQEADSQEESSFDMEAAQDTLSADIFGVEKKEKDDSLDDIVDNIDLDQESDEKPIEKKADKEEISDVDKALKEELKEEVKARKAPESWKKEMHEFYNSSDSAMQDYIDLRESQMKEGLEKDRGDANLGRTMRDIMTPHEMLFKNRGIEGPQAVQFLLNAHNTLSTGTIEQKQAAIQQLVQSYGIGAPAEGANPQITSLTQRLSEMEQNYNSSQQRSLQETQTRIETEVSAFADEHPLFDDLQDDIAKLITAGYELEDAYEKARWANPTTRQSALDELETERVAKAEKDAKKEAEEARKAKSVNVKGNKSNKTPTADKGKFLDTDDMRETLREINSRN